MPAQLTTSKKISECQLRAAGASRIYGEIALGLEKIFFVILRSNFKIQPKSGALA